MPTVTEIEHHHQLTNFRITSNSEIYSASTDLDHRKDQTAPEPGKEHFYVVSENDGKKRA